MIVSEVVSAALHAFWAAGASAAATSLAQSLVKSSSGNEFHGSWKSYSAGVVQQQPVVQYQPVVQQQPAVQRPISYYQPKQAQPQQQTLFEKIDYDEYRV